MKTPAQAIRIGIDTYYKTYQDAVAKFWEHGKQVAGLPVEHWLIAQTVQESRFDNLATSPVGAKGIAQFMQATANDVANDLKHLDLFNLK